MFRPQPHSTGPGRQLADASQIWQLTEVPGACGLQTPPRRETRRCPPVALLSPPVSADSGRRGRAVLGRGDRAESPGPARTRLALRGPTGGAASAMLLTGCERLQGGHGRRLGHSRAETLRQVAVVFRSRKRVSCCIALWGTHPLAATIPRRHPHAHMPCFFTENWGKAHGSTRDPAKTITISRPRWAPRPPASCGRVLGSSGPSPALPPEGEAGVAVAACVGRAGLHAPCPPGNPPSQPQTPGQARPRG